MTSITDMFSDIPPIVIGIIQFVFNIAVLGGVGIWRLAHAEQEISSKLTDALSRSQKENQLEMADLREKQGETERWVLEQFVRREDLKATIDQINITLGDLRQRFDTRMDRIENKIDDLVKR